MLRKLGLMLLPFVLLLAACSDDGGGSSPTATPEAQETSEAPDATAEPTDAGDGSSASAGDLFASANPLDLLNSFGGAGSGPADPSLSQALLQTDDLPDGFLPLGEFGLFAFLWCLVALPVQLVAAFAFGRASIHLPGRRLTTGAVSTVSG